MAKIRLNFSRLSISEKIARARQIVTAMTGNANFPTPTPALASIATAATTLQTGDGDVLVARQQVSQKISSRNEGEDALDLLMTQLAGYVESVAGDNETMIRSAGMDTRDRRSVSTADAPGQAQALTPDSGDHDGEIDLTWDRVPGAKSYVVEKSPDPPTATSWQHAGVSTKAHFTAGGLISGTRYWSRVASVNSNGQSGWSDPATKIAP